MTAPLKNKNWIAQQFVSDFAIDGIRLMKEIDGTWFVMSTTDKAMEKNENTYYYYYYYYYP